ncbi:MAG: hypothetical protein ACLRSW_02725 [Christensenellaceae bacterium]
MSSLGLKQLHIAETEKYAHVTFSSTRKSKRPSRASHRHSLPKVATYDLRPEMSAYLVTDKVLEARQKFTTCSSSTSPTAT